MRFSDVDDASELSRMAREIWMEYFPTIISKEETEYILNKIQSEEAIREQIENGHLYSFIECDGRKVGYFCIHPEGDSLFMSKLYVSKDQRGKGLGSKTLDDIIEKGKAMNMKRIYLRVNRFNTVAKKVYTSKGFVVVREEKLDIGDGFFMDDYLMEYHY